MPSRPNVLFIKTDHTNAEAIAPHSQCRKPSIDALASDSVRFHRCYTTNAICSPARASLMTSLYPSTHGMWDCTHTQRREWLDVPADRFRYFSQTMAEGGYANAYFGKWHVEQSNRLEDFGWARHDLSCSQASPGQTVAGSEVIVPKEGYRDYLLAAVGDGSGPATHPAFDRGIEFIREHARCGRSAQPFFCFVSTAEPHDPYIPQERFFKYYDPASIRLPLTLRETPVGKPEVVSRMRAVWESMDDADWKRVAAAYWAVITFLDFEVGRIVEALKEIGQYDNTIIVFTSDHGDMLGAHGLATKGIGTAYEEVYNIPLIMRTPGMGAGREEGDALVSLVDLAPTILDLCGLGPLPEAQGRSLRSVLEGASGAGQPRDAYAEFFGQRFVYTQRIVWHERWKYVFNPGGVDELYDLASDPRERVNLALDPRRRDVLVEMTKRMWRKMREIGDESLFSTHYATLRTAPIGPESIEGC